MNSWHHVLDQGIDTSAAVGRMFFQILGSIVEFESDLARMRTWEGMKVARAKRRLRGKQPKLSPRQEAHLVALHGAGEHTISELEELFSITRSKGYRARARDRARATT
jgi:DNA invertase Pin-like site-specific DNA recombinase